MYILQQRRLYYEFGEKNRRNEKASPVDSES